MKRRSKLWHLPSSGVSGFGAWLRKFARSPERRRRHRCRRDIHRPDPDRRPRRRRGAYRQDADDARQPGLRRDRGARPRPGFPVADDRSHRARHDDDHQCACWSGGWRKTGMITTRGFRDVIELGRRTRPQPYGMTGIFVPVIPRDCRLEVAERVEASGAVRTPLDEAEMRGAVAAADRRGLQVARHPFPALLRQSRA